MKSFRWPRELVVVIGVLLFAGVLVILSQPFLATLLVTLTCIVGLFPIVKGMIREARSGNYGLDILAISAILASLLLGEYLAAAIILIMLTGGEALEDYAQSRAKAELGNLLATAPRRARRRIRGGTEEVPVRKLVIGDIIIIEVGELIPVDGDIIVGSSSFDEAAITGESLPVDKEKGDEVVSGAINLTGLVEIRATHTSSNSQYERIIKLVREATEGRSPMVRLAERFSIPFTITAFSIAGLAWWLTGEPLRALEVLVVATPCPLLIATPVAVVSGMSRAAKRGIIIKHGGALEVLGRAKTIAFDKTGTLTSGHPVVVSIEPAKGQSERDLIRLAASLEQYSGHPLARAITAEAAKHNLRLDQPKIMREEIGFGVHARLDGMEVAIGKEKFIEPLLDGGVKLPPTDQSAAYVSVDGKYMGRLLIADELRPESIGTIRRLRHDGFVRLMMLTGDHKSAAKAIAARLGMNDIRADLLPAGKVAALHDLKAEFRPAAFVGDGVNDAPILAASDVGIALGAKGSAAASEAADIVIMTDSLMRVSEARQIAARSLTIAYQSIGVGIGLSVILMVIAAYGFIPPAVGAIVQEAVDVTVILNALRAHSGGS